MSLLEREECDAYFTSMDGSKSHSKAFLHWDALEIQKIELGSEYLKHGALYTLERIEKLPNGRVAFGGKDSAKQVFLYLNDDLTATLDHPLHAAKISFK